MSPGPLGPGKYTKQVNDPSTVKDASDPGWWCWSIAVTAARKQTGVNVKQESPPNARRDGEPGQGDSMGLRDLDADQRDQYAKRRDENADERDVDGEQRDVDGEQRDVDGEQRDQSADRARPAEPAPGRRCRPARPARTGYRATRPGRTKELDRQTAPRLAGFPHSAANTRRRTGAAPCGTAARQRPNAGRPGWTAAGRWPTGWPAPVDGNPPGRTAGRRRTTAPPRRRIGSSANWRNGSTNWRTTSTPDSPCGSSNHRSTCT